MIIIDASIANKSVLPHEDDHNKAKEIFKRHVEGAEIILTIDLIFYEIANTLATKTVIPQNIVNKSLTAIYDTKMEIYYPTEEEVKLAARLAKKYKTSVYDMLYAVVAKKHKTKLVTADEKFADATKFKFVKLLKDIS